MEIIETELLGWGLRSGGSPRSDKTVLLLPGGLCTALFYDDLIARLAIESPNALFVAATPPGFGGRTAPDDLTVEHFASLAGDLAAELAADIVVGHSLGANYVLEMVLAGHFEGPVVLLSPSFSAGDEEASFRRIGSISRVPLIGRIPWIVLPRILDSSFKGRLPLDRHDELVAEMKTFDMRVTRRMVVSYFDYLRRRPSLSRLLCEAGVPSWVAFGQDDEIGLTDDERHTLESCPHVSLVEIPEARHFVFTDQPGHTVDVIMEAMRANTAVRSANRRGRP